MQIPPAILAELQTALTNAENAAPLDATDPVLIADANAAAANASAAATALNALPPETWYTPVYGDTLASIAATYSTTVVQLQAWNSLVVTDSVPVNRTIRVG